MWCTNALNLTSQWLNVTSQCIQCINGISWKWRNTPLTGLWEADLFGLHRKKNWYPGPNIKGVQVFIPGCILYTLRLQGVWNSTRGNIPVHPWLDLDSYKTMKHKIQMMHVDLPDCCFTSQWFVYWWGMLVWSWNKTKYKLFLHHLNVRGRNEIRKTSQSLVSESMFSKIKLLFISERKRIDNRIK